MLRGIHFSCEIFFPSFQILTILVPKHFKGASWTNVHFYVTPFEWGSNSKGPTGQKTRQAVRKEFPWSLYSRPWERLEICAHFKGLPPWFSLRSRESKGRVLDSRAKCSPSCSHKLEVKVKRFNTTQKNLVFLLSHVVDTKDCSSPVTD